MPEEKGQRGEDERFNFGLGGVFKGVGNLIDLLAKMVEEGETLAEKGERLATRTGEIKGLGREVRGVYGLNIRTVLGGIPRVEHFGNLRATEEGAVVDEVREPLVDVFDEGEVILVVAEMPGVGEGDVQVEVKGDVLSLSTLPTAERKYAKEVLLPHPVEAAARETSYKNGVLELRLRKSG